ncbi:uncharacterized protein K460DRAFT_11379 [Cucurbitaria berberidis CBS 394.84]|uniref:Peptidase C14 caspase domain-containing protein n=1 Tax=Cucurbitaria berberidis CBS 394.84 TaxID=1168544 RepID=A0A9P4LD98_9PLEO|nr:uncharacterized protein K460DRAFT_11379 [Cucurbitaria berberidis CBS 394.84]KAF1850162.1 hypothetical protein K460DRAFT_11379 [Cucurbitaria berberidis CBS 394.84]
MELTPTMPIVADFSIQAGPSPPNTPSSDPNGPQSFRTVFEQNMPSSRKPISHDSASVLLLSYDSNEKQFTDLNVRDEVEQLENVFRKDYGFHVQQQLIKSNKNAHLQMVNHLSNFTLEHGKEHALLIVYYAGHGWRSSDRRRDNPGSFDLHPRKLGYKEMPSEDEIVMWEMSENTLQHAKGDVLVIFDCCDAASLAKLRSAGRAFEYLGACEKYTHPPGENSFTSALTWALREMSSGPPFTTDRLVSKIKEHEPFPRTQEPVLFPRWDFMPEHIWVSSRQTLATPTQSRRRSSSAPEFRDENCDYVDFRVTFSRPLSNEDGKAVADLMKPLVSYNRKLPLNARHVSVIKKGTCKPSTTPVALWARVRNHLVAIHRIQRSVDSSSTLPTRKRRRPSFEDKLEGPSRTKYPKPSLARDIERAAQLPTASSSEDHDSGSEETLSLRLDTTMRPAPRMLQSPYEIDSDPMNRIEAFLGDFEKLKQDAMHQPEVHSYLQAQIRAVLD